MPGDAEEGIEVEMLPLVSATQSAGFPPVPPRPTERARGPFYPLFRSNPPQRGGGHENKYENKYGRII